MRRALLSIAMWMSLGAMAAAQSDTGTLKGHVRDTDGGSLAGVSITVEGGSLEEPLQGETDSEGRFELEDLEPGGYKVTAEAVGFATVVQEGVPVEAGPTFEIEITMTSL